MVFGDLEDKVEKYKRKLTDLGQEISDDDDDDDDDEEEDSDDVDD